MNRTAILDALCERALDAFHQAEAAFHARAGSPCPEPNDDDAAMFGASDDDVMGWVDDLEHRVGFDVGDWRAATLDYLMARDESPRREWFILIDREAGLMADNRNGFDAEALDEARVARAADEGFVGEVSGLLRGEA